jgi:hypothetical protein
MIFISEKVVKISRLALAGIALVTMSACGGGGGSPGVTNKGGGGNDTPTKPATAGTLTVSVIDSSSKAVTQVTSGQTVSVRAKFTDSSGNPLSNAIVKFSASDSTAIVFIPVSASALTDEDGVAILSLKSATLDTAGPLTLSATATSGAISGSGTINVNFGASSVTVDPLSFVTNPTVALAAFNTIGLNIPLKSSSQSLTSITGITINASSDCKGDDKADIALGSFSNGVLSATYTNRGCTRGTDKIVVSVGSSSQSISLAVDSSNIGTIQYIGADIGGASLVLRGTGGTGRKESTVLTFKVVDQSNNGISGVNVSFFATATTGGLTVLPAVATSDANGNVTTTVSSGTVPIPVKINAQANRNGKQVSGSSSQLTIATGLPTQKSMSISAESYNFNGLEVDGLENGITVRMADQYGNPVSDNTAVNFVAEGGAIDSSCVTTNGGCSVKFRSQQFKPSNGRVTILAYAQGVEDFVDTNGDGQFSCATPFTDSTKTQVVAIADYRPLVHFCPTGQGEPFTDLPDAFLDTGLPNADAGKVLTATQKLALGLLPNNNNSGTTFGGVYDSSKGDLPFPYNSALGYSPNGDGKWGVNFIRRSIEVVFSGSSKVNLEVSYDQGTTWNPYSAIASQVAGLRGTCSSSRFTIRISDVNGNPLPDSTTLASANPSNVTLKPISPDKVSLANGVGGTYHDVTVTPNIVCPAANATGIGFDIVVTTPKVAVSFPFTAQ